MNEDAVLHAPGPDGGRDGAGRWDPLGFAGEARHALWLLAAVNALAIFGPGLIESFRAPRSWLPDFYQEYASARNALSNAPIYADHGSTMARDLTHVPPADQILVWVNAHPPTSILVGLPVARLEFPAAFLAWNLASIPMLLLAIGLIARELRWRPSPWNALPLACFLATSGPFREQVRQGQLNILLLLILVGAWACERNGRPRACGALLALAGSIKLFPLFLLAFFAYRGRWAVVRAGAVSLVALTAITAAVLGPGAFGEYASGALPRVGWFRVAWNNASLLGLFSKLFAPLPDHPHNYWWKTRALVESNALAVAGFAMAAAGLVGALARSTREVGDLRECDRAFAMAMVTMVLLSPVAWEHYLLLMVLPLALVWEDLPARGARGPKALFLAAVTLFWLGPGTVFPAMGLLGGWTASPLKVLTILSYQLYALLALLALLGLSRARRLDRPDALGAGRAWIAAACGVTLIAFAMRTQEVMADRGLFDWIGLDFAIYSATARTTTEVGPGSFYDVSAIAEKIAPFVAYYGPAADPPKSGPTPYPAPFIAPFLLLNRVAGPIEAFLIWTAFNLALLAMIVRGLVPASSGRRLSCGLAALAFLPVSYCLFLGQFVIVIAFGVYKAYRAMLRGHDLAAGCWLGLLFVKPQFAVIPGLVLVLKGRWRAVAGLAGIGLLLAAETYLIVGDSGLRDYLDVLRRFSGFRDTPAIVYPQDMINFRGILVNLWPADWSEAAGSRLTTLLSASLALTLLPVWRGGWSPDSPRFPSQWMATFLVVMLTSYHNHIHGATLLIVPALAMAGSGRWPGGFRALCAVAIVVPAYVFCTLGASVPVAWILIGLMLAGLALCVAPPLAAPSESGGWPGLATGRRPRRDAPAATAEA